MIFDYIISDRSNHRKKYIKGIILIYKKIAYTFFRRILLPYGIQNIAFSHVLYTKMNFKLLSIF